MYVLKLIILLIIAARNARDAAASKKLNVERQTDSNIDRKYFVE